MGRRRAVAAVSAPDRARRLRRRGRPLRPARVAGHRRGHLVGRRPAALRAPRCRAAWPRGRRPARLRPAGRRRGLPRAGRRRRRPAAAPTRPGSHGQVLAGRRSTDRADPGRARHRLRRRPGARRVGRLALAVGASAGPVRRAAADRSPATAPDGRGRRGLPDRSPAVVPAREIALLTNPTAGKGRGARARAAVLPRLRDAGVRGPRPAQGRRRRRGARPGPRTRSPTASRRSWSSAATAWCTSAVQALAGTGVPLGVVPAGTGNDVARYLDLPRKRPGGRRRPDRGRRGPGPSTWPAAATATSSPCSPRASTRSSTSGPTR